MNKNIEELVEYLTIAKVTTVAVGISELNEFFKSFEFHPFKIEWESLNSEGKKELVKSLLKIIEENSSNFFLKRGHFESGAKIIQIYS